jgi:hypothetical protein
MPYTPKYCCQCGEKIDRIGWKPWNSRRFCELCETDFKVYDWAVRVLCGIGLLLGLFGIGSIFQKPEKQLSFAANQFVGNASSNKVETANLKNTAPVLANNSNQMLAQANVPSLPNQFPVATLKSNLKSPQVESLSRETAESVYFCGAQTKKGTLCSRRVKGGGRCWQHAGQSAMLPQAKLIAAQ